MIQIDRPISGHKKGFRMQNNVNHTNTLSALYKNQCFTDIFTKENPVAVAAKKWYSSRESRVCTTHSEKQRSKSSLTKPIPDADIWMADASKRSTGNNRMNQTHCAVKNRHQRKLQGFCELWNWVTFG